MQKKTKYPTKLGGERKKKGNESYRTWFPLYGFVLFGLSVMNWKRNKEQKNIQLDL